MFAQITLYPAPGSEAACKKKEGVLSVHLYKSYVYIVVCVWDFTKIFSILNTCPENLTMCLAENLMILAIDY